MLDTWNPAELNDKINQRGTGGSGTDLPDITPADYGSYLAVDENGEWGLDRPKTIPDYSTTEVATGQKWINGKELYQKLIAYDMSDKDIQSGNGTIVETGVSDADFIFVDKFFYVDPNTNGIYTSSLVSSYNTFPFIDYTTKKIRIQSSTTWNAYSGRIVYILIKYTKTQNTEAKRKTKR